MNITVNAKVHEVNARTVEDALRELGFTSPSVATALNGKFVARNRRGDTDLREGDQLEVLAPMQGG